MLPLVGQVWEAKNDMRFCVEIVKVNATHVTYVSGDIKGHYTYSVKNEIGSFLDEYDLKETTDPTLKDIVTVYLKRRIEDLEQTNP